MNAETARLDARELKLKLRYNPRLDSNDMRPFVLGSDKPAQNKLVVTRSGLGWHISQRGCDSCESLPEFRVGNLKEKEFHEVWHGDRFNQVRTRFHDRIDSLCAKSNLLPTRGILSTSSVKVSIVIPCYNSSAFLTKTVQSVGPRRCAASKSSSWMMAARTKLEQ